MSFHPPNPRPRAITALTLELTGFIAAFAALTSDLFTNHITAPRPGNVQILVALVGLFLILLANTITPYQSIRTAVCSYKLPGFIIFCFSALLTIINLIGLFTPLRNPAVYQGIPYAGVTRVPKYDLEEFLAQMNRIESIDEQYPEYATRLTQLVFDSTVHYWQEDDTANAFNLRIPIHENFLIYLMHKISGEDGLYEFCTAEKAVERCASVCSQSSKILANILIRNRVRTHIAALDGHVVVRARVDKDADEWWVLDPDYGVVLQHDLEEIAQNPEIIISAYQGKGYNDLVIAKLIRIYGPDGNEIIDEKLQCDKEEHLYLLKWLLPIIGLFPLTSYLLIHNIRSRHTIA